MCCAFTLSVMFVEGGGRVNPRELLELDVGGCLIYHGCIGNYRLPYGFYSPIAYSGDSGL